MGSADFWSNQESAQEIVQQVKTLKNWAEPFEAIIARVQSTRELAELLEEQPDGEMEGELERETDRIGAELEEYRLRSLLSQDPDLAQFVWIEIAEVAAVEQFDALRELVRQLRPTGIRFGLEHAGERLASIARLIDLGIDYVKLDASVVAGLAADTHQRAFVQSTVTLVHSLALQAYAEGVEDAADAQALWDCGIDAITGPVVGQGAATAAGSAGA